MIDELVKTLRELIAERDALSEACGKWAEVSQSNYRRAKEAESQLAQRDAQVEALTAERDALRADECDPDGCAAHISAFASRVDALTFQLAQRDAALTAADELDKIAEMLLRMMDDVIAPTGRGDMAIVPDGSVSVISAWKTLAAYRKARGQDA